MDRPKVMLISTLTRWSIIGVGVVTLLMTLAAASDAALHLGWGYSWNDVGLFAGITLWIAIACMISGSISGSAGDR